MSKSRGPLVALLVIVGVAAGLTLHQLFAHRVTVRAADGSEVVIETDPRRLGPVEAAEVVPRLYGLVGRIEEGKLIVEVVDG